MSMIRRVQVFIAVTVGVATVSLLYWRVGKDNLFPQIGAGPFSPVVDRLESIIPVLLLLILAGTAIWVIAGGVQEERTRTRRRY